MAQLQPYVSNVPLQVAKNLRFSDANGIPVTEMLPIGMNGNIVADSPTTGYISRIGSILSSQIDLYNQVSQTLNNYGIDITTLQEQVEALELSGTTMPFVSGACLNGNEQIILQDAVQLLINTDCNYYAVLGTASALTAAILAEGATALNALPAFSQSSSMAGLSGWKSNPLTIADTINNLWLAYLDSRSGISTVLGAVTPNCAQVIVNLQAVYTGGGFNINFSGYTFIPSGYRDTGSVLVITDGLGGTTNAAVDLVARSQPGADPLFIGISGTPLVPNLNTYTVTLNSLVANSSLKQTCSKTVILQTTSTGVAMQPIYGQFVDSVSGTTSTLVIASGLPFAPAIALPQAGNTYTSTLLSSNAHFITYTANGFVLNFTTPVTISSLVIINWIAYPQTG